MSTAAQHALLDEPGDSAAVLGTGDDYVRAGRAAIAQLDDQLEQGHERLTERAAAGAGAGELSDMREHLHILTLMRDRIAESIERVSQILLRARGEDDPRDVQAALQARRTRDRQVLLDGYDAARVQLVVPGFAAVAATYRTPG